MKYNESESEIYIQGIRSDRVPEDLRMEVRDTVEEAVIKTIPQKKKCKKATWLTPPLWQKVKRNESVS